MINKLSKRSTGLGLGEGRSSSRTAHAPSRRSRDAGLPALPSADDEGNYPAREAILVSIARSIIRRRRSAKRTQLELAQDARVRLKTLQQLEAATHLAGERSILKIEAALQRLGV